MIEVTREMVQEIYSRIDFQQHGPDGIAEGLETVLKPLIELAEARGRVEAYAAVRASLRQELRGAPHNASPQAQITYVGGLARARRMAEAMYRAALREEEELILHQGQTESSHKDGS